MAGIISVFTPILLHMGMSLAVNLAAAAMGIQLDSTMATTITALAVIPVARRMYRRDGFAASSGTEAKHSAPAPSGAEAKHSAPAPSGTEAKHAASAPSGTEAKYAAPAQGGTKAQHAALFGCLCFILGGLLNIAWSGILNLLQITSQFSNETQEALLAGEAAVQILGLGAAVPAAEELIFRGLTYGRMKRWMPARAAVVLSSLLFALYHGNPIQIVFSFPMALALTAVYEKGGRLAYPVLFHMGSNLTAVFLNLLG